MSFSIYEKLPEYFSTMSAVRAFSPCYSLIRDKLVINQAPTPPLRSYSEYDVVVRFLSTRHRLVCVAVLGLLRRVAYAIREYSLFLSLSILFVFFARIYFIFTLVGGLAAIYMNIRAEGNNEFSFAAHSFRPPSDN